MKKTSYIVVVYYLMNSYNSILGQSFFVESRLEKRSSFETVNLNTRSNTESKTLVFKTNEGYRNKPHVFYGNCKGYSNPKKQKPVTQRQQKSKNQKKVTNIGGVFYQSN